MQLSNDFHIKIFPVPELGAGFKYVECDNEVINMDEALTALTSWGQLKRMHGI